MKIVLGVDEIRKAIDQYVRREYGLAPLSDDDIEFIDEDGDAVQGDDVKINVTKLQADESHLCVDDDGKPKVK